MFFFRDHGPRVTGSLVHAVLENYEELILTSSSTSTGPLNCGYTLKGGLLRSLQNIDIAPIKLSENGQLGLFHPNKWGDMGLGPYNWFLGPHSRCGWVLCMRKRCTFDGRLQVGYPRNQSKFNLLTSRVRLEGNKDQNLDLRSSKHRNT